MDFGAPGPGSRGQTTRDSGRGQARGALRTPTQPQRGSQDHGQVPLLGLHSLESGLGGQSVLLRAPLSGRTRARGLDGNVQTCRTQVRSRASPHQHPGLGALGAGCARPGRHAVVALCARMLNIAV